MLPCFSRIILDLILTVSYTTTVFSTRVHIHTEDLANPNSRKPIMEDFDNLITILKSSFAARKNVGELNLPYTRKRLPTGPSLQFERDAKNSSRYESKERGRGGTKCTLWLYLEANFPLIAVLSSCSEHAPCHPQSCVNVDGFMASRLSRRDPNECLVKSHRLVR